MKKLFLPLALITCSLAYASEESFEGYKCDVSYINNPTSEASVVVYNFNDDGQVKLKNSIYKLWAITPKSSLEVMLLDENNHDVMNLKIDLPYNLNDWDRFPERFSTKSERLNFMISCLKGKAPKLPEESQQQTEN